MSLDGNNTVTGRRLCETVPDTFLRRLLAVVLLTGVLLAAAPADETRTWLRRGNEAFQRGDYAVAISCYEKAEPRSTDPGEVAFNLATARYFLAESSSEGRWAQLREAEQLYRCCLDPEDPRHLQALYGLGTCLVQSAGAQGVEELNRAVECFERCLELGHNPDLLASARYNLEATRFRLAQVQPPPERNSETPPSNDQPRSDPRDRRNPNFDPGQGFQPGRERGQKGTAVPINRERGQGATETNDQAAPGKSNIPPVPDNADLPPLSPQDAAQHLEQASQRILQEDRAHRQRRARPALPGVRDW